MTINQKIIETLIPYCDVVVPEFYEGNKETYITFNKYSDRATDFGDSVPVSNTVYVHVHLYAPAHSNNLDLIAQIRGALLNAGFSWPTVEYDADKEHQHIVLDTQIEDNSNLEII